MAFTVTLLSWTAIEYSRQLDSAGQLGYMRDAIKWGADWLLKAHTAPNELWGQVGVGGNDHACWQRPEDMTTDRTAFKIDAQHPGTELAAEAAAALAATSIVFGTVNSTYAGILLLHAKQVRRGQRERTHWLGRACFVLVVLCISNVVCPFSRFCSFPSLRVLLSFLACLLVFTSLKCCISLCDHSSFRLLTRTGAHTSSASLMLLTSTILIQDTRYVIGTARPHFAHVCYPDGPCSDARPLRLICLTWLFAARVNQPP